MTAPIRLKTIFRIACWNLPIIQNRLSAELKNSETKPHHQNPNKTKRKRQLSINWQFSNTSGPAGGSRGSGDKVSVDTTDLQNIPPCTSNPSGVGHVFENLIPKFLRNREILKEFQQPANFFFLFGVSIHCQYGSTHQQAAVHGSLSIPTQLPFTAAPVTDPRDRAPPSPP